MTRRHTSNRTDKRRRTAGPVVLDRDSLAKVSGGYPPYPYPPPPTW